MAHSYMTADKLYKLTMEQVAPLPCQESYARNLAELFSYHLKKNLLMDEGFSPENLPSQSALILAPSGQGKSFLLKKMAEISNVNVIFIDGSTLSHEGWKGISLSQRLLSEKKALRNNYRFERSILVIDEVDKLRNWGTHHDQGGAQENLLQLFSSEPITAEDSGREAVALDTKRMTILLAGAFSGLEDIIRRRLNQKTQIGFGFQAHKMEFNVSQLIKQTTHQDLVQYGMMNELMGRIGSIITIDPMEEEDYRQLLTASNRSICGQYRNYFSSLYGVDFEITDAGIETITSNCMGSPRGARALAPMVNDLLRKAMTQVDKEPNINKVSLDAKDGCACIRYEMGNRKESSIPKEDPEKPMNPIWLKGNICYRMRAGSCSALVSKLCLFDIEEAGNQSDIGLVSAFLNCCIYYMKNNCRPEDFCLDSLFRFANATRKSQKEDESTFDMIMQGAIQVDAQKHILEDHYRLFCALFTVYHTDLLLDVLNDIRDKLMEESQNRAVYFEIPDVS